MIDYDKIKANLEPEDIIEIIKYFIPDLVFEQYENHLVLPTICHNLTPEEGSMKLYYYFNTHLFRCYTQCDDTFDIYELVKKMLELRNSSSDFNEVFNIISSKSKQIYKLIEDPNVYQSILGKYTKSEDVQFPVYDKKVLGAFQHLYPQTWIDDGITIPSMDKYQIRFSVGNNQIIIPHYNIDNELIGIRVRNLDEQPLSLGQKYMPAKIDGKFYTHPLMYNLYGLNFNQEAIKRTKTVFIFEGEKSSMICNGWYGDNNIAVATCGDKINKFQIKMLAKLGVQNAVLCYDRMNNNAASDEAYFNKLYDKCERYKNYMNFSFIFDRNYLVGYKDAPVDKGQEIFEKLLKERVCL